MFATSHLIKVRAGCLLRILVVYAAEAIAVQCHELEHKGHRAVGIHALKGIILTTLALPDNLQELNDLNALARELQVSDLHVLASTSCHNDAANYKRTSFLHSDDLLRCAVQVRSTIQQLQPSLILLGAQRLYHRIAISASNSHAHVAVYNRGLLGHISKSNFPTVRMYSRAPSLFNTSRLLNPFYGDTLLCVGNADKVMLEAYTNNTVYSVGNFAHAPSRVSGKFETLPLSGVPVIATSAFASHGHETEASLQVQFVEKLSREFERKGLPCIIRIHPRDNTTYNLPTSAELDSTNTSEFISRMNQIRDRGQNPILITGISTFVGEWMSTNCPVLILKPRNPVSDAYSHIWNKRPFMEAPHLDDAIFADAVQAAGRTAVHLNFDMFKMIYSTEDRTRVKALLQPHI